MIPVGSISSVDPVFLQLHSYTPDLSFTTPALHHYDLPSSPVSRPRFPSSLSSGDHPDPLTLNSGAWYERCHRQRFSPRNREARRSGTFQRGPLDNGDIKKVGGTEISHRQLQQQRAAITSALSTLTQDHQDHGWVDEPVWAEWKKK